MGAILGNTALFGNSSKFVIRKIGEDTPGKAASVYIIISELRKPAGTASVIYKIQNLEDCTISTFNSEFSPEEVGKITGIIDKFDNLAVDSEVVGDYINVLVNYKEESKTNEPQSDEDFLKEVAMLRKKKNG